MIRKEGFILGLLIISSISLTAYFKSDKIYSNLSQGASIKNQIWVSANLKAENFKIRDSIKPQENNKIIIRISAIGDIMVHQTQLNAQKQSDGTYSFDNNFQHFKPLFDSSDVMIANLETTFAGEKRKYSAYPRFNTPDDLADAMKNAGINIVATANNHTYDFGGDALIRTIDVLNSRNMEVIGTQKSSEEKNYIIKEVNGVKIGFSSYTYESGKSPKGLKTINGLLVSEKYEALINSFNPYKPKADILKMQEVVKKMRADSAEFIVFVLHWGKEYMLKPSENQLLIAKALNKAGVDVIFGSHPHIVQAIDFVLNDSTQHLTFVAYSMGNFISNQRYETLNNYRTEDGLFIGVEIEKEGKSKPVLKKVFYEPTWVNRYKKEGKYIYEVVPARLAKESLITYNITDKSIEKRVKSSSARTIELIQTPLSTASEIFFNKYLEMHQDSLTEK